MAMAVYKKYVREGFRVSARTEVEIRNSAEQVRKLFCAPDIKFFDVVRFIERRLPEAFEAFRFEIVDLSEMPDREAEMNPTEFCIRIQEPIYDKAMNGDGHCRFTLAHELGHFFLHRHQSIAFGRPARDGNIPAYCHSEWQADVFARNLLAPWSMTRGMTSGAIEVLFEVSHEVALIISGEKEAKRLRSIISPTVSPMLPGFESL